eukprot:5746991-Pyramimonas_sp.AAC.1
MVPDGELDHLQWARFVEIHSLKESQAFNGTYGELLTFNDDRQRWKVRYEPDRCVMVLPDNLRVARELHPGARCYIRDQHHSQRSELTL